MHSAPKDKSLQKSQKVGSTLLICSSKSRPSPKRIARTPPNHHHSPVVSNIDEECPTITFDPPQQQLPEYVSFSSYLAAANRSYSTTGRLQHWQNSPQCQLSLNSPLRLPLTGDFTTPISSYLDESLVKKRGLIVSSQPFEHNQVTYPKKRKEKKDLPQVLDQWLSLLDISHWQISRSKLEGTSSKLI